MFQTVNSIWARHKRALKIISLLVIVGVPIQAVQAHGTITTPASRVYNCYLENPENPTSAACQAAVATSGSQGFYDWNGVRQGNANDNHTAVVPDGQLCSGGDPTNFGGLDLARNDWVSTNVSPGAYTFTWTNTAAHATSYYDYYITQNGYNPTQPLAWNDLQFICRNGPVGPESTASHTCTLPSRTGRHVVYSVWQRSDSPEAFYACVDVNFGGGSSSGGSSSGGSSSGGSSSGGSSSGGSSSGGSSSGGLSNGQTVTGLSASQGNRTSTYYIDVPAGASNLSISISGGTGDADLYVKKGSVPTDSSYDCRPYDNGNNETCGAGGDTLATSEGRFYINLKAYSTFSGVSLTASYQGGGSSSGGSSSGGSSSGGSSSGGSSSGGSSSGGSSSGGSSSGGLSNGQTVTGLSASQGNYTSAYYIDVPAGASNLSISISGGTGDADLYVKKGSEPTDSSYDCRPYDSGNNETCGAGGDALATSQGRFYIKLKACSTFSGVSLTASYQGGGSSSGGSSSGGSSSGGSSSGGSSSGGSSSGGSSSGGALQNGVPVSGLSASQGNFTQAYYIDVPSGASSLAISISGGSGDADLYVKKGSVPTSSSYDCRPYDSGNNETCGVGGDALPTSAGRFYINLNAYSTFSGVTLTASFTTGGSSSGGSSSGGSSSGGSSSGGSSSGGVIPNDNLPNHALVGYWHNFDNGSGLLRISEVPNVWDVIVVAFADDAGNGSVAFNLDSGLDKAQFISDVAAKRAQGKIVVLSFGGQNGTVTLNSAANVTNFVNSTKAIMDEYGFDGIDIDLESGAGVMHGAAVIDNMVSAVNQLVQHYGSNFYLSMAPEHPYVQGGYTAYAGIWGAYIPIINGLRNQLDLLHVQLYNNGGLATPYGTFDAGSVDMMVASAKMLIEGFTLAGGGGTFQGLQAGQVALGLPSGPSSAGSGQATTGNINRALDCITKGTNCGTVSMNSNQPSFRGVMTWSINWDENDGRIFSGPVGNHVHNNLP